MSDALEASPCRTATGDPMSRRAIVSLIGFLGIGLTVAFGKAPTIPIEPTHKRPAMAVQPPVQSSTSATIAKVTVTPTPTPTPSPTPAPTINVSNLSHAELMTKAGIVKSDQAYAEWIIQKESGWRADAVNSTGCIGLGQNCPDANGYYWLKEACPNWQNDPVCQLRRFDQYAEGRYGGWKEAYIAWGYQGWW